MDNDQFSPKLCQCGKQNYNAPQYETPLSSSNDNHLFNDGVVNHLQQLYQNNGKYSQQQNQRKIHAHCENKTRSLFSERRNELWQVNLTNLSPDSRDLFDDIEDAETIIFGGKRPIKNKNAGTICSSEEIIGKNGSNSVCSLSSSCTNDNNVSKRTQNDYYTPDSLTNDSFSSSSVTQLNPFQRGITGGQRLSFSSAIQQSNYKQLDTDLKTLSDTHEIIFSSINDHRDYKNDKDLFTLENDRKNNDNEKDSQDNHDTVVEMVTDIPICPSPNSVTVIEEDESEILARQLMEEEQYQLLERMRILQQAELERIRLEHDSESTSFIGLPARQIFQEETEQLQRVQEEHILGGFVDNSGDFDPDNMSYEQLLEIGDCIGNVKQERWQIDGQKIVESIPVVLFSNSNKDQMGLKGIDICKCIVCQYDFEDDDKLKILPCKHAFHQECIDLWLKDHDTCVTCKKSLKE